MCTRNITKLLVLCAASLISRPVESFSSKKGGADNTMLPKLVVFDLDYTLWRPELYQLDHPILPLQSIKEGIGGALTASNEIVDLFPAARRVLCDLHQKQIPVAIASRTHLEKVALQLLSTIMVDGETSVANVIGDMPVIIRGTSKDSHFRTIRDRSGISFVDMTFYDNELLNIEDVQNRLGVHSVYCPYGITDKIWESGMTDFVSKRGMGSKRDSKRRSRKQKNNYNFY
uniref:Magnesium-dependent phosphatase-1 n=1 Tax=Corethron hystrix TaxID=216773 RepID=A0A7S1BPN2_9STRA